MNHRPRTAVSPLIAFACAIAALLAVSVPASAQIPPGARSAADATPFKPQIDQFVQQQVARLSDSKTPGNIHSARVQLESQLGGNVTPSFLQVYAASLNTYLQPLANAKDLITRLNAAIIVAHAAEKARNVELAPAAAKFMNDPQDAVALWGVKAAKQIIPIILNVNPAQDTLTPVLLNCVKKNWFSGAIAYEAYDAYRLNTANAPGAGVQIAPGGLPPANPAAIKAAVPGMLGLLSFRADLYAKGVPPLPAAEKIPFDFFGRQKVWQQMTPAQQTQLMQLLLNILSFGGQHAALLDTEPRGSVADMLAQAGSTLHVIGDFVKDTATQDAVKAVRSFGVSTPGDVIFNTTTGSVASLLAAPKWKGQLKAPPIVAEAGKILSPTEPLDDEAVPATTAGSTGGAAAPAKAPGAGTGNAGGGAGGGTGATGATGGTPGPAGAGETGGGAQK